MTAKKRILIIDDHPLYREGLKSIIAKDARYEVAGEASTARQGLEIAKKQRPELALVDVSLPDQTGIALIGEILKWSPETRIIIVSMHSKIDYIVQAFRSGAMGYIVKESAADMLLKGIQLVLSGNYFMDASVSQEVIKKLAGIPAKEKITTGSDYDALTPREQEIVVLLAEGLGARDIAEKLFISPKTVENHRANIMRKLGVHSLMELTRYAAKLGLIDIDLWKK